jgi:ATP-dependent protease HslVU (ClpYQ) peptidase subunit
MSVIAAVLHNGKAYLCAEGLAVSEGRVMGQDVRKIYVDRKLGVALGIVGDLAECQRIFSGLEAGAITLGRSGKAISLVDPFESVGSANMIVAFGDGILTMDSNGGTVDRGQYAAIGDGCDVAAGALAMAYRAGLQKKVSPKKLVREAVEIACEQSVFCGGKITSYEV